MGTLNNSELAHLKNRVTNIENDLSNLRSEFQTLLNSINNSFVSKSSHNADQSSNLNSFGDLQRQIRTISEKINNILIPEETRAYLSLKEINVIKSGFAETQAKIAEMNNLVVAFTSMIAKLEADWGSSKITYTG